MSFINKFFCDILINIAASIIFLIIYEKIIKRLFIFSRYKDLRGYYLVCNQDGTPINHSPEKIPNFLKIEIDWKNPNVLITKSLDFDNTFTKKWNMWMGKIVMNELTKDYGSGFYLYGEGAEPGLHEIFIKDKETGTILVRVIDYGKANKKERKDNFPDLQNWKKVDKNDPLIEKLRRIM